MQEQEFSLKGLFFPFNSPKAVIFIVIIGLTIYLNSLFNGFVGDDFDQLVNNPEIHSLSNIPGLFTQGALYDESGQGNNYYRAMTNTVFSLIYSVFKDNAFGYHLVQVLIHIFNSVLTFLILKYFFKKEVSLLMSILFLAHPLNTEAVVYACALGENLVVMFGLTALYIAIKKINSVSATYLAPFFLLLSLLSKETGIFFLFMYLLYNFFYQKKELVKSLIQILIVLSVYMFLRFAIAHIGFGNQTIIVPIQGLPLSARLINIPKIIYFYLSAFFYPKDLIMFQSWLVKRINFADFYVPLIFDAAFFGLLIYFSKIVFKKNPKYLRAFLFFSGWFLAGLVMLLHLIPLDQTVSERWFYSPLIGLLGMGGALFLGFREMTDNKRNNKLRLVPAMILIIIILFSIRVTVRNTDWHNEESLYIHDIKYNSESYQLETGLGKIDDAKGDVKGAEKHYIRGTELFPGYITFNNLASYYLLTDRAKEAVEAYVKKHTYNDTNPISWVYLGMARYKAGDKNGAIADIKKAYSMSPNKDFLTILKTIENNEPITFQR
jgi:protein O-mannosyl-transferase